MQYASLHIGSCIHEDSDPVPFVIDHSLAFHEYNLNSIGFAWRNGLA
jgi:hypothetical protein